MGVEGCAKFIKYAMFLFNFLIFIGGAALLGVGIWVAVDTTGATAILTAFLGSTLYSSAAYILIVCGAIILIIGFLGCCGAIKESKCMLGTFFALMLLIFIILLVGAILAFVFRDTVTSVLKSEMESSLADKYGKTDDTAITQAWDSAQELFKCCGVSGNFTSMTSWYLYQNSSWYAGQPNNASRVMVPASCCKKEKNVFTDQAKCQGTTPVANSPPVSPPGTAGLKENPDMYGSGCYDVTYSNVMSNAIILGAIAIAILVVMLLAMIFSICLCRNIDED